MRVPRAGSINQGTRTMLTQVSPDEREGECESGGHESPKSQLIILNVTKYN